MSQLIGFHGSLEALFFDAKHWAHILVHCSSISQMFGAGLYKLQQPPLHNSHLQSLGILHPKLHVIHWGVRRTRSP